MGVSLPRMTQHLTPSNLFKLLAGMRDHLATSSSSQESTTIVPNSAAVQKPLSGTSAWKWVREMKLYCRTSQHNYQTKITHNPGHKCQRHSVRVALDSWRPEHLFTMTQMLSSTKIYYYHDQLCYQFHESTPLTTSLPYADQLHGASAAPIVPFLKACLCCLHVASPLALFWRGQRQPVLLQASNIPAAAQQGAKEEQTCHAGRCKRQGLCQQGHLWDRKDGTTWEKEFFRWAFHLGGMAVGKEKEIRGPSALPHASDTRKKKT